MGSKCCIDTESASRPSVIGLQGEKLSAKDFKKRLVLGQGYFGNVYLVEKLSNKKLYAMKVLKKRDVIESDSKENAVAERHVLTQLHSPFIVRLHYSFQTPSRLYLVMEYMPGGDLSRLIERCQPFPVEAIPFYIAEILIALEHLHNAGVLYRDLKPENVLIDQHGHLKLADFGISKTNFLPTQKTTSVKGTPLYMAPEVLKDQGYSFSADFWSLGAIAFCMATGKPPHYSEFEANMLFRRMTEPVDTSTLPVTLAEFADKLLCTDPLERSIEFTDLKQLALFEDLNWNNLETLAETPPFSLEPPPITYMVDPENSSKQSSVYSGPVFSDFTYVGSAISKQSLFSSALLSINS